MIVRFRSRREKDIHIPLARFLASCSGVKLATPLEPGADLRFLTSGPWEAAGVDR